MNNNKIPLRMCMGCGEMKPKNELFRLVNNKEGKIIVDKGGKEQCRGAYVCKNILCIEKLQKNNRLKKTFKMDINSEFYELLKGEIK